MKLTEQQQQIIGYSGDLCINAVAGSGKSTTLREYVKARPKSRFLYLAFNRTVKEEARQKLAQQGITHCRVETAHSLAFAHIMRSSGLMLQTQAIKPLELAYRLGLPSFSSAVERLTVARHIDRLLSMYCNSASFQLEEVDYCSTLEGKPLAFVRHHQNLIYQKAHAYFEAMQSGEIPISHDGYLKLYQLSNPRLNRYDYLLFDEAQDASPSMLHTFLEQQGKRILVGDMHQQIYGWRQAINSLQAVDFPTLPLSQSFRFGPPIARLARAILDYKYLLDPGYKAPQIEGLGGQTPSGTFAILARSNLSLLDAAIHYLIHQKSIGSLYFEGRMDSYLFSDTGTSLLDVLNLFLNKPQLIRDPLIAAMPSFTDLIQFMEDTQDRELKIMIETVLSYGADLPDLLKTIRLAQVLEKDKAEMVFSTVHRSKGMEYGEVELCDDFIGEETVEKLQMEHLPPGHSRLNSILEEINILYVGATRTQSHLYIPDQLIPSALSPAMSGH